jgi:hypothetical protein
MESTTTFYRIPESLPESFTLSPDNNIEKQLLLKSLATPSGALKLFLMLGISFILGFKALPLLKSNPGPVLQWIVFLVISALQIAYYLMPKLKPLQVKKQGIGVLPWKAMHLISLSTRDSSKILRFQAVMHGHDVVLDLAVFTGAKKLLDLLKAVAEPDALALSEERKAGFKYADSLILKPQLHADYYAHQSWMALNSRDLERCGSLVNKALEIDPENSRALKIQKKLSAFK